MNKKLRTYSAARCLVLSMTAFIALCSLSVAAADKPNILVIWGDDIGWSNISAYHRGMLGGTTPNIDRIAKEGALFTDYYGEQSCTAGRSCIYHWPTPFANGTAQGWAARCKNRVAA